MRGMALLLVPAQTDQSQNFPADCQMHCDGRECALRPIMVAPPAHYPSLLLTISSPHTFPRWGNLRQSSDVTVPVDRTTPSVCRWWCFHHLVVLYHLIHLIAWAIGWLLPQFLLPIRKQPVARLSGAPQNHPVMLIRLYATFAGIALKACTLE